jgi:hypothetical protein
MVQLMGYLKSEPMPEILPPWTAFREITAEMPRESQAIYTGQNWHVYVNSRYMVEVLVTPMGKGANEYYLSIKDLWRSARHDWRDFQKIKNDLVNEDAWFFEAYPAESRLVDTANQYHLFAVRLGDGQWLVPPVDFARHHGNKRNITDLSVANSVQRPFEPHVMPPDLQQMRSRDIKTFIKSGLLEKPDRNVPCPCQSGKKYKRCCG